MAHHGAPFARGAARFGGGDRGGHDVGAGLGSLAQGGEGSFHGCVVALAAPCGQPFDLVAFGIGIGHHDRPIARRQRRGCGFGPAVDADDRGFLGFNLGQALGVRLDQAALHIVDGRHRAAHGVDLGEFGAGAVLQGRDLAVNRGVAVEKIVIFQKVGFIGQNLLHPQRPLLIPRARQAQSLVPSGQLHRTGAGLFRQRHRQHLNQDAVDVVFGLLFGQAQGVDLHTIAEAAILGLGDAIAGFANLVPQIDKGAHLAQLGDKADAGVDEEGDAADHIGEVGGRDLALQIIQHGAGGCEREGQLLLGRRPCLLQVIGTHVHRVPFRQVLLRIGRDVGDHAKRGLRRGDISPARQVFFDDVVLHRALQGRNIGALFFGHRDVKRQKPRGGGVDGHRGVHLFKRDILEQRPHVAQMADRDANLADLAFRQFVIRVIARLRRQIEGHRKPGLPARQVVAVKRVRGCGGGMARIGAEQPGLFFLRVHRGPRVVNRFGNFISSRDR